jgi:hypothetical protein
LQWILAVQCDGWLGDHPREAAAVRPGGGMHEERMTQEHISGFAGG